MLTDQATEDARRGGKSTSCRTGLSLNETRELRDPGRENMNVPPIPAQCAQTARIATEIATLGFALPGTLTEPMTRCGHPGCRCHADPPRLHGPYHQRTRKKVNGSVWRGVPAKLGWRGGCGWSRAGVAGVRCAARAPAGAVTGSRVADAGVLRNRFP